VKAKQETGKSRDNSYGSLGSTSCEPGPRVNGYDACSRDGITKEIVLMSTGHDSYWPYEETVTQDKLADRARSIIKAAARVRREWHPSKRHAWASENARSNENSIDLFGIQEKLNYERPRQ